MKIHIHILSSHSVLLDILTVINTHYTQYVHILHYVHIYTHNNMRRCNRLYISRICNVMDVHISIYLKCNILKLHYFKCLIVTCMPWFLCIFGSFHCDLVFPCCPIMSLCSPVSHYSQCLNTLFPSNCVLSWFTFMFG